MSSRGLASTFVLFALPLKNQYGEPQTRPRDLRTILPELLAQEVLMYPENFIFVVAVDLDDL